MTRSIQRLTLLVSSTLAVAALAASAAWAGDRYGPTDGGAGEYGYQSSIAPEGYDYGRAGDSYGDSRWEAQSSRSRSEYERRDIGSRINADEQAGDVEQVDPCAVQYRVAGHRCGSDEDSYRGGRVSREGSSWTFERVYEDERASAYGRSYEADRYADACVAAHERLGEHCPYAQRPRYRDEDRVVWVEERLPDSFFISDGGVGPGIVDYGGGGGGGGFVSDEGFANASANASASASARTSVSLAIAVHNHNHGMGMGRTHKTGHSSGCGCK